MVSALRSVFLQMSFVAVLARIVPGAFCEIFFCFLKIRGNWKPYLTLESRVVAGPKIFVKALKMISG